MKPAAPGLVDVWGRSVLRSPLLPVAILYTLGVLLDRALALPATVVLALLAGAFVAWATAYLGAARGLAVIYLAGLVVGLGMLRHQSARHAAEGGAFADILQQGPVPVQAVGRLAEEPQALPAERDVLRSRPSEPVVRSALAVERVRQGGDWQSVEGYVRLYLSGQAPGLHFGDEIEVTGMLVPVPTPDNPGEVDRASELAERGIQGQLHVAGVPGAWTRRAVGWHGTLFGWLVVLRGQGQATLATHLPEATAPLAMALLLGDGAPLDRAAWERYVRTGVVAVLAVSGQHLIILAAFLEFFCRACGFRQRRCVLVIALLLFGYAVLTGGRPPALRAAIMTLAFALAILLRRCNRGPNTLALAWLLVGLLNPGDLTGTGCQFSFLAVAVLVAFPVSVFGTPTDPLAVLLEQSDPFWWQMLREGVRLLLRLYIGTLILWLVLTPLAAWHYHLIAPAGILLGPPLVVLATVALFLGFALLLTGAWVPGAASILARPLDGVLSVMQGLIDRTDALPGAWFYLPGLSVAWILLFYTGLLLGLAFPWREVRWRVLFLVGPLWLMLVLLMPARLPPADELRVTFLSVGHGTCVVLEFPDGRVALYDAGSLRGPVTAVRQIAPYLWHRGIGRIDEVFLSHADLDHFNGLSALLERFSIGRVSTTPSFAVKPTVAVRATVDRLSRAGLMLHTLRSGDRLEAGTTCVEVLHPPAEGPAGSENARSLVLRVQFAERSLLLTGDLEGPGLERLLALPPQTCEVVMAPHHGSKRLDPAQLVAWCRPRWLVACQGGQTGRNVPAVPAGARWLSTHTSGAITFRGTHAGWQVETFR